MDRLIFIPKIKILSLMVITLLVIALVSGCGTNKDDSTPEPNEDINAPEEEVLEDKNLSPLTGLTMEEEALERRPLAVMINNSIRARPQSGLVKADIIYEFLAEGGITRLMAIYHSNDVDELGPLRSARPYYVNTALEMDALYVHVGASSRVYDYIKSSGVDNLDEFTIGQRAFWRTTDRKAPHNLYGDTYKLRDYALERDLESKMGVKSFEFLAQDDENLNGQDSENISINYTGSNHKVSYEYDEENNNYLRFNSGVAHVDKVTDEQLKAQNILVRYTNTRARDDLTLELDLVGEGKAQLFNNGQVYEGTWKKDSLNESTMFLDKTGQEFKLVPGQTWIQVVPANLSVEY